MAEALPLGSVRMRVHRGHKVAFVKVTHLGPLRKRWKRLARIEAAKHFGPLPDGAIVEHKDGDRSNVAPDNLIVAEHHAILKRTLSANPALEAKRRKNQARATSRIAKSLNPLRSRVNRSVHVRGGQYYAVCHSTQMVIFVPCRTKRQAERYGEVEAYRHLELVAMRGVKLETECRGYRREIPDEGQAWKWGTRKPAATSSSDPLSPDSTEITPTT